jgi:acyl dehydratase
VNAAMSRIRARFGYLAIGLGYSGLRFIAPVRSGNFS